MDTSQCAVNVSSSGFNILDSSYLDLEIQVHPSSCQLSIWQKIDWPFSIFDFILYLRHGSIILSKSGSRWLVCRALSHNLESLNINIAAQSSSLPLIWSVSSHFPIFRLIPALLLPSPSSCLDLVASISQRGIKGEIRFSSGSGEAGAAVTVTADLEVGLGAEGEYTWGVFEFPIDYTKVSTEQ